MKVHHIDLGETGLFSPLFMDFIRQKDILKPFYSNFPGKDAFKDQIRDKARLCTPESRKVLVENLKKQYSGIEIKEAATRNVKLLGEETTFTVTTGHQLNIFTGPLYFIYKIATVIKACAELSDAYSKYHFVPVYWMASEDHDFEEISSINLFGKKYDWQTDQKGAVGRFDPTSMEALLNEIPGSPDLFKKAYLEHGTLASAVRYYVNELFGDKGLVVIDGDSKDLKKQFRNHLKDELIKGTSAKCVKSDSQKLTDLGYKTQITSREINLFYLDKGLRERITREGDTYKILNTSLKFTQKEILKEVENSPEKFSPNVILRPLYQEIVLPNLAYIGGPAEIIYWLQLKGLFSAYEVPFPILFPRNFVLYLDSKTVRKLQKSGLKIAELFKPSNGLIDDYLKSSSQNELELAREKASIGELFGQIQTKIEGVDKSLEPLIKAEHQRAINSLEKIEKKIIKAEKRHHEEFVQRVLSLKEDLFPNGAPQERTLNYLNFELEKQGFIEKVLEAISPFDLSYHVMEEGEDI